MSLSRFDQRTPGERAAASVACRFDGGNARGYACGLTKRRHLFSTSIVALLIGMVIIVIIDIDRPNRGLIRVGQGSMIRLLDSMKNDAP